MDYIWLALLFLLGLAMLAKPESLWKIEHLLTTKNGEPSELYIALMRIGGSLFMIISVIFAVYVLV